MRESRRRGLRQPCRRARKPVMHDERHTVNRVRPCQLHGGRGDVADRQARWRDTVGQRVQRQVIHVYVGPVVRVRSLEGDVGAISRKCVQRQFVALVVGGDNGDLSHRREGSRIGRVGHHANGQRGTVVIAFVPGIEGDLHLVDGQIAGVNKRQYSDGIRLRTESQGLQPRMGETAAPVPKDIRVNARDTAPALRQRVGLRVIDNVHILEIPRLRQRPNPASCLERDTIRHLGGVTGRRQIRYIGGGRQQTYQRVCGIRDGNRNGSPYKTVRFPVIEGVIGLRGIVANPLKHGRLNGDVTDGQVGGPLAS